MIDYIYYVCFRESIYIAFIPHKNFQIRRLLQQVTYSNPKLIRNALHHLQSR